MSSLYQLAEELNVTPKALERWLKSNGLGGGKRISNRATQSARAHFRDTSAHPMAGALEERDGLGAVARHEELTQTSSGIRVEERPKLKWGQVERDEVNVAQLDMSAQRDFFKQLRAGGSAVDEETSQREVTASTTQQTTRPTQKGSQGPTQAVFKPQTPVKRTPPAKRSTQRSQRASTSDASPRSLGSLASLAPQLDSVTDRRTAQRSPDPDAERRALEALRSGVQPLRQRAEPDANASAPPPRRKRGKAAKTKKSQKSQKNHKSQANQPAEPQRGLTASHTGTSSQAAPPRPEPSFQELFERPQVQALQARVDQLTSQLHEMRGERDALSAELKEVTSSRAHLTDASNTAHQGQSHRETEGESPAGTSRRDEAPQLIWDHFTSFGLNVTQARLALLELLDHPQRGPELMYSLKHDQPMTISRGFSIVCSAQVCQEVASVNARQGLIELEEKHLCMICQGSDSRGWYRRLTLTATHTQRDRVLVVGGDDADHQQLKELARQHPGLSWDFIGGGARLDQTTARAKVAHKAAVVLWGGVYLPHKLSKLVKAAADRADVTCFALEPGTRNVAHLCREVLKSWGITYD